MEYVQDKIDNLVEDVVAKAVLATGEFQRLRTIQQLGPIQQVFPSINHTRYEHSIGVYLRAGVFLEKLQNVSGVFVDDFHKRCVKLAGLLHDIGHGPYSHLWEKIVHDINPGVDFTHEEVGAKIVENIFINVKLSEKKTEHDYGVILIKSLITGNRDGVTLKQKGIEFIFDIINNKSSAIDVDRFDYLIRDWEHCRNFITVSEVNIEEHLKNVYELFSEPQVSADRKFIQFNGDKLKNINSMFELREYFHENIYQRVEVHILEDILLKMIKLIIKEIEYKPKFLTFNNLSQYVNDNYCCRNPINDKYLEKWLSSSSNPEVRRLYKVFTNLQMFVEIADENKAGFTHIPIDYKYKLPNGIKECLYNMNVSKVKSELKMEYEFTKDIYYRIKDC